MSEPKKSIRIILFTVLIALNIGLLAAALQRALPKPATHAKEADPAAVAAQTENRLYLPLVSAPYQGAIVLLPGDGVYYERDQDVQIVHVVGEVLNNTSTPVSKVMIEATLNLKSGGSTSLRGFPLAGSLAPGARACFDLYLVEQKQVENYAVKVLSYATGGNVPEGVEISARESAYDPQNDWYRVAGTVTSADPLLLGDLSAVVTLFDGSGRVLGCEQSYARPQTEEADAPAVFEVLFMNRDFSQGARFTISAASAGQ
jgi:hypothetical protein